MVFITNNRVHHEKGCHPQISLLKTLFLFQQQQFGKLTKLSISEAFLFGVSSGPGFLYKAIGEDRIVVATHSLNSLQDLATSTGTWINRRFSATGEQALIEMADYLSVWKAPVLVTVPQSLFPSSYRFTEEIFYEDLEPVTKCLVTHINESSVECMIHSENEAIVVDRNKFLEAINRYRNRWVDLIFPSKDISLSWIYKHSLSRQIHRVEAGWESFGTPKQNIEQFFHDFVKSPNAKSWQDVFSYASSLADDFGRAWYSAFLREASNQLESRAIEEAAAMYERLSLQWKLCLNEMRKGRFPQEVTEQILSLEEEVTMLLKESMKRKEEEQLVYNISSSV